MGHGHDRDGRCIGRNARFEPPPTATRDEGIKPWRAHAVPRRERRRLRDRRRNRDDAPRGKSTDRHGSRAVVGRIRRDRGQIEVPTVLRTPPPAVAPSVPTLFPPAVDPPSRGAESGDGTRWRLGGYRLRGPSGRRQRKEQKRKRQNSRPTRGARPVSRRADSTDPFAHSSILPALGERHGRSIPRF